MGEMVSYPSSGDRSEGYLAVPAHEVGAPIIVIQERWGIVPHIRALADRFAAAGFTAFAPDLAHLTRTAEPGPSGKLLTGQVMDEAGREVAAAAAYLAARPGITGRPGAVAGGSGVTAKVGVVGFLTGGSLALWSATLSDLIVATVGFYPALPWERMSPKWSSYSGKAALIHCSEENGASGAPGIQAAALAIKEGGGEVILHDYPGTGPSFFNDDLPAVYKRRASASAWARTLEFLRSRLD